jgi:hypothetical protein
MHDAQARVVALVGPASCCAFEYDDNRWLDLPALDRLGEPTAQVRCGTGAITPPSVRTRSDDIGGIDHEHALIMSPPAISRPETAVSRFDLTVLAAVCDCDGVHRLVVVIPERVI